MGDPKKPKKNFNKPRSLWTADQLMSELQIIGNYGLRNKRELWKAETELSRIRKQARALLALPHEERSGKERELLASLNRIGFVQEGATLDDVLNLTIETLMERRLQTLVLKKGLAKTPWQARQAVVHGHITINERIVDVPSYVVSRDEEGVISLRKDSSYRPSSPAPSPQEVATEEAVEGKEGEAKVETEAAEAPEAPAETEAASTEPEGQKKEEEKEKTAPAAAE